MRKPATGKITICVVDENAMFLNTLRLLLGGYPNMTVAGYYETADKAMREMQWPLIDILLTGLELCGKENEEAPGLKLIQHVFARSRDTHILVYPRHDDRATVLKAIRAGADGYILKSGRLHELITALEEIYTGCVPVSPSIARTLLAELQASGENASLATRQSILSMREQAILQCLSQGMSYKEIANHLSIMLSTVHTHIKNIYSKLHVNNKQDAIRKGMCHNLL